MAKLGVQLIVFGSRPTEDLPGVLADVAAAGYDGAETGTLYPTLGVGAVVRAFQDAGLALTGIHTGYADMADEDKVAEHIAFLREADSRYLICSGVADNNSLAGYEQSAETFNRVGEMCREAGVVFCYHNHAWEFKPLEGGAKGIHRLCELTDPALVKLCIDVYWVTIGGEQPAEFIARYADRCGYYHFKDGGQDAEGRPTFIELGQGEVDLVSARQATLAPPLDWIVCEQDRSEQDPALSVKQSFAYLKQIGY